MAARPQFNRGVLGLLALALLVPTAANCNVGVPTWWAPVPVWTFLLRASFLPAAVVATIPGVLFLSLGLPSGTWGRTRRGLLFTWLALGCLAHVGWHAWLYRDGISRLGAAHVTFVAGVGSVVLVGATVLAVAGARSGSERRFVFSAWLAALWTGWMSVPWFLEAP